MKKNHPDQLYADFIGPIAGHCHRTPGLLAKMVRWMDHATGKTWHRQQIETYLHVDPARRKEPRIGMGLLLQRAYEAVKGAK